jgi:hypothetical protein
MPRRAQEREMKNNFSVWMSLSAAIWWVAAQPAMADATRDQVMDGVARCDGIPDNRVWLDCFYGSAQPMRALLGLSPAPEGQTRLVPAPGAAYDGASVARRAPAKPKSESFWSAVIGDIKPLVSDMPMTAYGFGSDGRFTVTMSDGHVWRQTEADVRRAKWKKPASSYKATIDNGTYANLYDMRVENVIYKVARVR